MEVLHKPFHKKPTEQPARWDFSRYSAWPVNTLILSYFLIWEMPHKWSTNRENEAGEKCWYLLLQAKPWDIMGAGVLQYREAVCRRCHWFLRGYFSCQHFSEIFKRLTSTGREDQSGKFRLPKIDVTTTRNVCMTCKKCRTWGGRYSLDLNLPAGLNHQLSVNVSV